MFPPNEASLLSHRQGGEPEYPRQQRQGYQNLRRGDSQSGAGTESDDLGYELS